MVYSMAHPACRYPYTPWSAQYGPTLPVFYARDTMECSIPTHSHSHVTSQANRGCLFSGNANNSTVG